MSPLKVKMYGKESGKEEAGDTTQKEKKTLNVKIHANAKRKKYPPSSDKLITSTTTQGCIQQSSLSDLNSDFGRISSNLQEIATEFWTNLNLTRSDSKSESKSAKFD